MKLKYMPKNEKKRNKKVQFKEMITNIKHKTTRHNMISEAVMPTKRLLL